MKYNPLVSVCCITYNHEHFIVQAIEGFLMQKTNFPIEIIIHDDASSDKTTQIVKQYAEKHPDLINFISPKDNQYSKYGCGIYLRFVFPVARGKYISICDGDDYWTDPYKLQKQVDFLEAHDDYVLCAGKSLKRDGNNFHDFWSSQTGTITFKDIAHSNFIVSNTVVFRNIFKNNESCKMSDYLQGALNGDIFLSLALLMKGKGYILPDCIGVYRMHDGGIMSKKPDDEKYSRALKTRNIIIEYLKDIKADDSCIKDIEHGYLSMLEGYLSNNMLTEEFIEIVPTPILNKVVNNLMNNYQRQIDSLSNKVSQSNYKEQSGAASSVECLVAERDAALAAVVAIKHSKSWRLTAPLRLLGHLVKGDFPAVSRAITYIKKRTGVIKRIPITTINIFHRIVAFAPLEYRQRTGFFLKKMRMGKIPTYFFGPMCHTNHHRIEINITFDCNLKCLNCNRSCGLAPAKDYMSLGQIKKFIRESLENNRKWEAIVVMGGEPTLHPEILKIMEILTAYKKEYNHKLDLCITTNGYGPEVIQVLAKMPKEIIIRNTYKKSAIQENFYPFSSAPVDSKDCKGTDYSNKCEVTYNCGLGLSKYGYYICSNASGIDRVFGLDIGWKELPPDSGNLTEQAQMLCRYCGRFRINRGITNKEVIFSTWKVAYNRYSKQKPVLTEY